MAYLDDLESDVELYPEAAENIPSGILVWPEASAEQIAFMRRVYDINLRRAESGSGTFTADVPEVGLDVIENDFKARVQVSFACKSLLSTVRRNIKEQNIQVTVGLTSAYRSASHQFRLWQRYFPDYYRRTGDRRKNFAGGEHSEEAAQFLASFVRQRIAVPGFSLHNSGMAVDFLNIERGRTIPNKTTQEATSEWRKSWFWDWLSSNANRFGFFQNTKINEPWHWEYRGILNNDNQRLEEISDVLESGGGTFRRLRESDIKYLALEGGGGKGFVYIGAIKALQDKKILRFINGRLDPSGQIKGISGASAGAISAMLLSIGYDAEAIRGLLTRNNLNKFFDLPAIPSKIPQVGGCQTADNNIIIGLLQKMLQGFLSIAIPSMLGFKEIVKKAIDQHLTEYFRSRIDRSDINGGAFSKFAKYPFHYLNDIIVDLGIFSGCNARDFFDSIIKQKSGRTNLTFSQHYEIFRIKLILTGTNLEKGTSEYFSKDTTPHMPVADAVRISMGLPFIFKPYRIHSLAARMMGNAKLAGLWVDGGVRNNLPIRAFENEPGSNPKTLGIRLGVEEITEIKNIVDMLVALTIKQGLLGSGEADISSTSGYKQQTIILSTKGLSLTDFNPPSNIVEPLVKEAENSLSRYFDQSVSLPEFSDSDGNVFNGYLDEYTDSDNYENLKTDSESTTKVNYPLNIEFINQKYALHPNGYKRLYYVTTGARDANLSCFFPFQIMNNHEEPSFFNLNQYKNCFFNVYVKVQFTRTSQAKQILWQNETEKGKTREIWKQVYLSSLIRPGEKKVFGKGIEISSDLLKEARAISNTDFSARLDLEFFYSMLEYNSLRRPAEYFIKKESLLFYIVKPVEFVFGSALRVKPDKKKELELIISLRKEITTVPTSIKSSISITDSKIEITSQESTMSIQHSSESGSKSEGSAKITVPFAKFLELSGSLSQEHKVAIVNAYSVTNEFISEIGNVVLTTYEIPAASSKGKYRRIYLEPNLVPVPIDQIYYYQNVNEFGMAGKVEVENSIPFIYRISGWRVNIDEFTK